MEFTNTLEWKGESFFTGECSPSILENVAGEKVVLLESGFLSEISLLHI